MKKRKNKICIIILTLISILYALFLKNNPLEKTIKNIGVQTVKILKVPINYINNVINIEKILNENKKLKKVKSNDFITEENKELKDELKQLKENLNLNTLLSEYNPIASTIVIRNLESWYSTAVIDKGFNHNIKDGYAVINQYGLVGYTKNTTYSTSDIKLLTSASEYKISVKIEVNDYYIYGLITGYDEKSGELIVEGISENTIIPTNSFVTTSGFGNEFPSGILIGQVVSISKDNFDLARTLKVKPAVDFNNLTYVTVLTKGDAS